ncbi:hypothetical protein [Actinomadura parmotrematis]|uniref:hypothetical protein n=1 Tax=Actinomadura parmotrematis TaxID=2864039 RepID=UPI00215DBF91|nr:hypothetical protein [Actinomadura parmotrematis]
MTWSGAAVALGFAGLAVLSYCAFKLGLAVRRLGRELDRTRRRLVPEQRALADELRTLQDSRARYATGDSVRSS